MQQTQAIGKMLTTQQIADFYGVKASTVHEWAKKKRIPSEKIGRDWRFPERIVREAGERQPA